MSHVKGDTAKNLLALTPNNYLTYVSLCSSGSAREVWSATKMLEVFDLNWLNWISYHEAEDF